jgi:hypothetical protein
VVDVRTPLTQAYLASWLQETERWMMEMEYLRLLVGVVNEERRERGEDAAGTTVDRQLPHCHELEHLAAANDMHYVLLEMCDEEAVTNLVSLVVQMLDSDEPSTKTKAARSS